jgi:hypothetical protein
VQALFVTYYFAESDWKNTKGTPASPTPQINKPNITWPLEKPTMRPAGSEMLTTVCAATREIQITDIVRSRPVTRYRTGSWLHWPRAKSKISWRQVLHKIWNYCHFLLQSWYFICYLVCMQVTLLEIRVHFASYEFPKYMLYSIAVLAGLYSIGILLYLHCK